ncbi:MAG: M48 family metallopeptidase [Dysosmobacter sp.]
MAYWSRVMEVAAHRHRNHHGEKAVRQLQQSRHSSVLFLLPDGCPEEAVDLVVVHELCHLREMNHGPGFYALLERYLPDWKERKSC